MATGARAYAMGSDVAFASAPDLHTAAHAAAHTVQQRGGFSSREVAGVPAEDLLDGFSGPATATPGTPRRRAASAPRFAPRAPRSIASSSSCSPMR